MLRNYWCYDLVLSNVELGRRAGIWMMVIVVTAMICTSELADFATLDFNYFNNLYTSV